MCISFKTHVYVKASYATIAVTSRVPVNSSHGQLVTAQILVTGTQPPDLDSRPTRDL